MPQTTIASSHSRLTTNARPDRPKAILAIRRTANWARTTLFVFLKCRYLRRKGFLRIPWSVSLWSPNHILHLGDRVQFGPRCVVHCDLKVGDHVLIAPEVAFIGRNDHRIDLVGMTMWESPRGESSLTYVEDDCWIGYRSIIVSGVTIGRGSVVAAGAVVIRDVEPYSVVAGVPATEVRKRFTKKQVLEHEAVIYRNSK